ncbi:hypothetical protein E8E15_010750 [Penicillium rubens]|uniref:uncharacterized protein n=1 Tax=Penicillium rubens TaxID=1108849 RepID=UPI001DB99092|nr:uncharacterized protein N7525_003368 [Penicillium rubens]KAF3030722.1 hypothetical protein E8E15_010750 [Penicillium rubens]KAJ5045754.1 hypothetical protein NUH16_002574 [Penicillium rubens]KAJ5838180.1 hypothetical protein N7525_003368 [Penicillium rubens]KAJ5866229.1 hypothetical protein N7534_000782 [Penicillium rubens]
MSSTHKPEKTANLVKALGLTPSQAEHLLLGYLCMQKPEANESSRQVDWNKLAELSNVTPSSARTVFTKARRRLEKWEENRTAGMAYKGSDEADEAEQDVATETAHADNRQY